MSSYSEWGGNNVPPPSPIKTGIYAFIVFGVIIFGAYLTHCFVTFQLQHWAGWVIRLLIVIGISLSFIAAQLEQFSATIDDFHNL